MSYLNVILTVNAAVFLWMVFIFKDVVLTNRHLLQQLDAQNELTRKLIALEKKGLRHTP